MAERKPPAVPAEIQRLTIDDLAARMQVSVGTVYAWNRDGTGPTPMRRGTWVRYRLEDVMAWEESLLAPATA